MSSSQVNDALKAKTAAEQEKASTVKVSTQLAKRVNTGKEEIRQLKAVIAEKDAIINEQTVMVMPILYSVLPQFL